MDAAPQKSKTYVNGFLIGVEVVTAVFVLSALCFCYVKHYYMTKRRHKRKQAMIENAIYYQESRFLCHLEGECHSTCTIATSIVALPPPSYSPPDPLKKLPNDVITRLDHLLSQNRYCTQSTFTMPPKYDI